jgi:tripeptide aminopeptidase
VNPERLLNTFLELVRIDSPTNHEAAVADYCRVALEAAGCRVTIDDTAAITGSDTGNLIAELPGELPGKLFFSAHMDTVNPGTGIRPVVENGIIRASGDTILGGDDKVGVASIIEMIRVLNAGATPHATIGVLLSVGEETGLKGAKAICADLFSGEPGFVLDADGRPGEVVAGAPYQRSFKAIFTGRAAHAGVSPEKGVSAIELAASAINAMPLGRLDEVTTANIGTIRGGSANNIVAEECLLTGECRSLHEARLLDIQNAIIVALSDAVADKEGSVDIEWTIDYAGFLLDDDDPVVQLALRAAEKLGLPARTKVTGGGADTNVLRSKGLRVVTLGTGMEAIHGTNEQLAVADLEALCSLIIQIASDYRTA